ncbi:hypothetical protein [Sphingopyxis macrogoltabida]|uniref:Secreted protein n=2 Tax=Sphingopyxis macrogoltabida TaxID=33050 RepID=A0AAC8YY49_SPHMC|nr:hypothetical protein [Sphingopyxis macrogoltabida]ALJ12096.1 hypothetical protein LH19_04380 [Sphingopyxis macrogoltabida]AMU88271.1 hypothetical protein ATM17_04340 [Sphingopyxis macrogoltabida]
MNRLVASLCVALMMFYATTIPAKATDQLQHSPSLMVAHDHDTPGSFMVDAVHDDPADHADHHAPAPDTDDQPSDHFAGGHHHHGDTGPNLLVPGGANALGGFASGNLHGVRPDRQFAGLRPVGPERPPRLLSLNA